VTTQNLRDWLEIVGLFAVVASLIFVGLQMKQTHEIALASQYQERANNQLELLRTDMEKGKSSISLIEGSPTFVGIEPTPEKVNYVFNYVQYGWLVLDNIHFQYEAGFLPHDHWESQVGGIKNLVETCSIRWIWTSVRRDRARRSFVDYVDSFDHECVPEDDLPPWRRPGDGIGVP
jgi:hypothetical protein